MLTVVMGGSGSGKSAYAESLMDGLEGHKYYIATMQVYDEESAGKVARHRQLRAGKGFETIEQPREILRAVQSICSTERGFALLECMSNLVANEMFSGETAADAGEDEDGLSLAEKITSDIFALAERLQGLVVVTNNVFEDGIRYDGGTMEYLSVLGEVNRRLCEEADRVIEVVVGIPVVIKDKTEEDALCR